MKELEFENYLLADEKIISKSKARKIAAPKVDDVVAISKKINYN